VTASDASSLDWLATDRFSAVGDVPVFVVDAARLVETNVPVQALVIAVDRLGSLPDFDPDHADILLTTRADAPAPWISIPPDRVDAHVAMLSDAVTTFPVASTILASVLRLSEGLPFAEAVTVESLAYSSLLGGAEFRRWLDSRAAEPLPEPADSPLRVDRDGDVVTITLNDPASRNAMTAAMRDALYAALANALDDPTAPGVVLRGAGRCFSSGGALGEFGMATDLAQAHVVRTLRSCTVAMHALGGRAEARLHGACVGSGLEIPAAAALRIASSEAWFQLPELRMGLIPGASGTASVARAIGRHRTAWMVLSGKRVGARQALDWGLIHAIEDA
jgi:Enoyl-CoA hydratase/isomerase